MRRLISLFTVIIGAFSNWNFIEAVQLPSECNQSQTTIAAIDCLQSQKDIQKQLLEYLEIKAKISEIHTTIQERFTPATGDIVQNDETLQRSDPVADRANWFDQNMVVYAIAGKDNALTAYASLDGLEYRLQKGDSIRLAKVIEVHPRQIVLSILDHEIIIGLAGRTTQSESATK